MIGALIYYAIAVLMFVWWKVACMRSKEKPDYSERYYSKSKESDNALMVLVCTVWPLVLLLELISYLERDRP